VTVVDPSPSGFQPRPTSGSIAPALQRLGCRSLKPPRRSSIAPRRRMVASSNHLPTSWIPIGEAGSRILKGETRGRLVVTIP
jgi:hypothetical protein